LNRQAVGRPLAEHLGYPRALLDAIPHLSQARALTGIPGSTPGPGRRPSGCRFNTRCEYAQDRCREEEPVLQEDAHVAGHTFACHFPLTSPDQVPPERPVEIS